MTRWRVREETFDPGQPRIERPQGWRSSRSAMNTRSELGELSAKQAFAAGPFQRTLVTMREPGWSR